MSEGIQEEKVSDGFKEQTPAGIWSPQDIGEKVTGTVIEIRNDDQFGKSLLLQRIDTDTPEEILTPSHKALQSRINKVIIGDLVRVTFIGEEPPKVRGHKPTRLYKVEVKEKD